MKLLPLLAAGLSLAAAPSFAQSLSDHYVFVYGGINFESELDTDGLINGAPETVDVELDDDFNFGFGVGASVGGNFRVEAELNFSDQDVDQVFFSGNGAGAEVNVAGDIRTTTLFANGYYDIETNTPFTPFVGAGLGLARVDQDFVYGPGIQVSDNDTVFATQLIAGASYDLTDTIALTGDVRYRRLYDVQSARLSPVGASTGTIEGDLDSFSVNVGVRFNF